MKNQILILVSLLLMIFSNNVISQNNVSSWKVSSFENEIPWLVDVHEVNDSILLSSEYTSNINKSINNGETWQEYPITLPRIYDIFNYKDTLYATCQNGILAKSIDIGETWDIIDTIGDSDIFNIYITEDFSTLINKNGLIYTNNSTADGYQLVHTLPNSLSPTDVKDIYVKDSIILLLIKESSTNTILYKSTDNGSTYLQSNIFNNVNGDCKFIEDTLLNIVYLSSGKFTKNAYTDSWNIIEQSEIIANEHSTVSTLLISENSYIFETSGYTVIKLNKQNLNSIYEFPNKFDLYAISNNDQNLLIQNVDETDYKYTKNGGYDLTIYETEDIEVYCNSSDSIKLNYNYSGFIDLQISTNDSIYYIEDSILYITEAIDTTCIITYSDGFIETKDTFNIYIKSPVNTEICIIANDPETNNNIIVIEQSDNIFNNYNIYKEVQGEYMIIGEINYGEESFFIDPETPKYPDYYKVSITDNCGNETETSDYHKTLFLQANLGTSGEHNLDWSSYEGTDDIKYQIVYAGTERTNMEPLDTIYNINTNKYTNINPLDNKMYYQIGIVKESNCNYEFTNNKLGEIDFTQSVSNILEYIDPEDTTTSIKSINMLKLNVSPNPTVDQITINIPTIYLTNIATTIIIYSTSGQIVYTSITYNSTEVLNVDSLEPGLYLITIENEEGFGNTKLVKK